MLGPRESVIDDDTKEFGREDPVNGDVINFYRRQDDVFRKMRLGEEDKVGVAVV